MSPVTWETQETGFSIKPKRYHNWKVDPTTAAAIQRRLLPMVRQGPRLDLSQVQLVAGADVSYKRGDTRMFGAVVAMSYPELVPQESRWGSRVPTFPYVPGLLAFREAPVLIPIFRRLASVPDVVIFDGQGIAHPRGLGLATHLGIVLGVPTVGVAKTVLVGEYEMPDGKRGSRTYLVHGGRVVGAALRTQDGIRPVFVSVGCHIDLDSACELVLSCSRGYRTCKPIRTAHTLCNQRRASSNH